MLVRKRPTLTTTMQSFTTSKAAGRTLCWVALMVCSAESWTTNNIHQVIGVPVSTRRSHCQRRHLPQGSRGTSSSITRGSFSNLTTDRARNFPWNQPTTRNKLFHGGSRTTFGNLLAEVSSSADKDDRVTQKKRSLFRRSLAFGVGSFYAALGWATCWIGIAKTNVITPKQLQVVCSVLWLGFVLAISFLEAWVKFRAPFLPRHYGLDVGRTVFPVLNAVEVALGSTLWLVHGMTGLISCAALQTLALTTLILLSQVLYVTPQLVLMGKHAINDAFVGDDLPSSWTAKQQEIFANVSNEVKGKVRPPAKLHLVYFLQEVVKVVLLGKYVWSCR